MNDVNDVNDVPDASDRRGSMDVVAHLAVPVLLIGFVLRRVGARQDAVALVDAGTVAQFAAVLPIAAGFLLGAVRGVRPSPGAWALLAVWAVTTVFVWGSGR
ncbi:hypothetical protein ACQKM2_29805 [Streptomyces sp. NPDC004126]|uniref:hypothetical protein n=1 Tax=Streptomyces sp. NPDC004126 TaxID=3390695 RepID=UPI003CFC5F57